MRDALLVIAEVSTYGAGLMSGLRGISVLGGGLKYCCVYSDLENLQKAAELYLPLRIILVKDSVGRGLGSREDIMCIVCEHELWDEHRALGREFFKPCKTCKKFPGGSSEGTCYHCYAVGNTIDECPECVGKPWSEEFLAAKEEIECMDEKALPF